MGEEGGSLHPGLFGFGLEGEEGRLGEGVVNGLGDLEEVREVVGSVVLRVCGGWREGLRKRGEKTRRGRDRTKRIKLHFYFEG